ncbi:ABC transporter substrate-binding protein [Nitrosopumilus sp.]|uniref:ABC transporter substrate-binding protein n=1 Tax=Nitrosopumilus sp. TaxID=2024843 RepID=UPI0026143770|nr:ABC transporter substrate-binding protein [Nitrosopumilus sp.]
MKSTQLLSVVFSLIMFTGVSAGSVAFAEDDVDSEMREKLERYCEMSDEDKRDYLAENDKTEEHAKKMDRYCTLSESDRADFIAEHRAEYKAHMKDRMYDKITDIRKHMDRFCELSDEEKDQHIAEHEPTQEHIDKVMRYCSLDDEGRDAFVEENRDEIKAHMKEKYHDKMSDKKKHHMNYDRLCAMAESDRAAEITDVAKLDRINNWCDMTPDEREDYKKKHHAEMKYKMHDKMTDRKHDMKMNKMHDKMHDKMSDKSKRLKAMIMAKYDISDERLDEIKMKYREKYGDLSDEHKSELKKKFMKHMKFMKHHMTDERKAEIHDRISEMRDFKAELRDRASDMTDEEKQQLREEFIEKAKDLQLAWITPRTQIAAGIDAAEVECREGFTLVMKSSNGVPMCLKADTALKMIDRGIVVPAV